MSTATPDALGRTVTSADRSDHANTSRAVVFEAPGRLAVRDVDLDVVGDDDLLVRTECSGISTGTEKLLWEGRMPEFPGLGYPLVPGYEAVGKVVAAGANCRTAVGTRVFVPGATCFGPELRGLFGASASMLVVPEARSSETGNLPTEQGVLLALAGTAMHILTHRLHHAREGRAISLSDARHAAPELIVGHGTLGRLLARLCVAVGAEPPVVWERDATRRSGAVGYPVIDEGDDERRDYRRICDVSGAGGELFDTLIARLARGGELVLGGFYSEPVAFTFPPAFMREAHLSIAAQWLPRDLQLVQSLIAADALSLDGLVTHRHRVERAEQAYPQAFNDKECLKMVLDWSEA